jgi:Lon protease-like protein
VTGEDASGAEPLAPLVAGSTSAMFPLGSVLLPSMWLPLRVFEPRYRQLTRDVLAGDGTFGVVMIERGSEVGGGDVRTDVGCRARVVRAEELGGGQWGLLCVGVERMRVREWLSDDPYPRAVVDPWPDEPAEQGPGDEDAWARVLERFGEVRRLAAELGLPGALDDVDLDPDPAMASYQVALASPLGALDRHRVLASPSRAARLGLLEEQLDDAVVLLRARLDGL